MQVVIAPAIQFPLFLSLLLKSVLWAYARLQSSSCVDLATSCNLVHVLTFYNFSFPFGTYASRNRPCRPVPYGPMQVVIAPAVQSNSFFSVVSQNSSTQKKIANLKSQIPSLAFHSEQHANAQTTLPLYFLSESSAKLQCCRSRKTPCQPSGSTRCPLNMTQVRKGNPPESTNITSILFSNYISTKGNATTIVGKPHWQSLL